MTAIYAKKKTKEKKGKTKYCMVDEEIKIELCESKVSKY